MQHPVRRKFKVPAVKACHAHPASRANGYLPCYNDPMSSTSSEPKELIASLEAKYMWWPAASPAGHGEERIIAERLRQLFHG